LFLIGFFLAIVLLSLSQPSILTGELPGIPGGDLFTNGIVLHLKVRINPDQLAALKADSRHYARCTVLESNVAYQDVGIHLKGSAGSFREFDDKPALTLSFNHFKPGQRFHGLRKIHLNNSVQDPSYMTELICGQMFEESGVPAARVAHARVTLNDRSPDFYVIKEGFTRDLLGRFFKNVDGNLYDGGFLKDIPDLSGDEAENQSTNKADLKALADAAREANPRARWERLNHVLDLDRFIPFMAMEILTWHWDGYAMNRNNYRLYHDPTSGKMVFLAHGMDQMFQDPNGSLSPEFRGMVADAVMRTPEGRSRYYETLGALFTNVFKPAVLTNRVDALYARIHPAVVAISEEAGRAHEEAVNDLRSRIVNRYESIRNQLTSGSRATLPFDNDGVARLDGWTERGEGDRIKLERKTSSDGKTRLRIVASEGCLASWRTRVALPAGRYRFEARARARKVQAISDDKGEGAGLRISGRDRVNGNKLTGSADWTTLTYPFEIGADGEQVELVCELRANGGEVWFDADSTRIVREKP